MDVRRDDEAFTTPRQFRQKESTASVAEISVVHDSMEDVEVSTAHNNYLRLDANAAVSNRTINFFDKEGTDRMVFKDSDGTVVAILDSKGNFRIRGRVSAL